MIILHDSISTDLSHIQAIADIEEGFGLFDYVSINQANDRAWIGQVVQPNQNISIVGGRLDPTILHGLKLMQSHREVQSVESVQVFDVLILGEYDGRQLLTPRLRPLPGAVVHKLDAAVTSKVIGIPSRVDHADGTSNVIGELLNADNVPLCIDENKYNYHVMIAGGTGSGKSNAAANLIEQALLFDKFVLVHDAKPDYGMVDCANTDPNVRAIWDRFEKYGLKPHMATTVHRIGFYGKCNPKDVDTVVGFRASDFDPEMLAGLFFTGSSEQLAFEGFAGAAYALEQKKEDGTVKDYTLGDILEEVKRRNPANNSNVDPLQAIHKETGSAILRKAGSRSRGMPWLDSVGKSSGVQQRNKLMSMFLDGNEQHKVQPFDLSAHIEKGKLLVIDYSQMDEQSYALMLSYFLRICQNYRKKRGSVGIVQMVDEAHRVFDNDSRHGPALAQAFERVMREGRSVDHSIILSLQNASQVPPRVMNNLNTKVVMRQNSKTEADAATQTMGKDFSTQSMRLGTGHALVSMHESRAVVLAQMAPSPYELMRNDNTNGRTNMERPLAKENDVAVEGSEEELDYDDIPF